jgi:hypothetical protein
MLAKVEKAFQELLTCLQIAKLYGIAHPMFQKSLDKAYAAFEEVFLLRPEMVIGIVGDELAFEKEILFDLGKLLRPAIFYLKERNIERLAFYRGLSKEELSKFVGVLVGAKEDFKPDPQVLLTQIGIKNISISKLKVDDRNNKEFRMISFNFIILLRIGLAIFYLACLMRKRSIRWGLSFP